MAGELEHIITQARTRQVYRCAHCDYPLSQVPFDPDLGITCPECGYKMIFSVKVQLMPRDPEYDREVRTRLGAVERVLFWMGVVILSMVLVFLLMLVLIRGV